MSAIADKKYNSFYVYALCGVTALGSLNFGMMLAIFAPVQDYFQGHVYPSMTVAQIGFITACVSIGATIGSLIVGEATSRLGRKNLIMIVDLFAVASSFATTI